MDHSAFLKKLAGFSLLTALLLAALYLFPIIHPFMAFAWVTYVAFVLMTYLMFLLGKKSAASSNKGAFINMSMVFNGLKIFLSVMLILFYLQLYKPSSQLFLIPFFIVYVLFTIFEIYFLSKIARLG